MTPQEVWPTAVGIAASMIMATLLAGSLAKRGFPVPDERRRLGCVDGLRGYLALSVLCHHFILWVQLTRMGLPWGTTTVPFFEELGSGAVELFFLTTGFLFYPRVLAGFRATDWRGLLIGRVFRILPLVVAMVALLSVLCWWRARGTPDATFLIAALTWITALGDPPLLGYAHSEQFYVLWSLNYEWIFYLVVLPLCALAADLFRGRAPSWTVPLALLAGCVPLRAAHLFGSLPVFLALFAFGMLAYEARQRERLANMLSGRAAAALGAAALAVAMTASGELRSPLFALFFVCAACGNSFGGLLKLRGALVLGEASFSIYLLHCLVLSIVFIEGRPLSDQMPPLVLLPATALVVVAVSAAAYLTIERPFIEIGSRVRTMAGSRPLTSAAIRTAK